MTVTDAERAVAAVGVNVSAMLQEAPATRVVPHVPPTAKDVGFVPVIEMLAIFSAALPVFESVMLCTVLVTPTTVFGNVSDAGVRFTTGVGAGMPVPLKVTLCGEPGASSVMLTAAE